MTALAICKMGPGQQRRRDFRGGTGIMLYQPAWGSDLQSHSSMGEPKTPKKTCAWQFWWHHNLQNVFRQQCDPCSVSLRSVDSERAVRNPPCGLEALCETGQSVLMCGIETSYVPAMSPRSQGEPCRCITAWMALPGNDTPHANPPNSSLHKALSVH